MSAPLPRNRVQLLGIDERSSGIDPVLAGIFQTMRASIGVAPSDLVRLLHTRPEVLANLEAGRVRALPPLPELVRLLKEYGALLDIDADPIIRRIKEQTADKSPPLQAGSAGADSGRGKTARIENGHLDPGQIGARLMSAGASWWQGGHSNSTDAATVSAAPAPIARQPGARAAPIAAIAATPANAAKTRDQSTRRTRSWRWPARAAIAATFVAGAAWTAQSQPPMLHAAVNQLPPGIAKSLRRGIDMIAVTMASTSTRDGLTWIETTDPRRRKADRLPVKSAGELASDLASGKR